MSSIFHIQEYRFGKIVINGETYTNDLIILPDKIIPNWWRKTGHILDLDDCLEILSANPQTVIFALGAFSRVKLSESLKKELNVRNIRYHALSSKSACEAFNKLSPASRTAAAFHLTC